MLRRYLLAVLILILACELGLTAQLYVEKQLLSEDEVTVLERAIDPPKTPGPNVNEDGPVAIEYLYTEPQPDSYDVVFEVTNFGSEPVQFPREGNNCLLAQGSARNTYLVGPVPCQFETVRLEPGQSTTLEATSYYNSKHYILEVKYLIEPNLTPFETKLKVSEAQWRRPWD